MLSKVHYLVRSRIDGKYLAAHVKASSEGEAGYLLLFREDFEALSYLNTHGKDIANRFAVELVSEIQVKGLLQRWGFSGVGIVQDPLIPQIQFLTYE